MCRWKECWLHELRLRVCVTVRSRGVNNRDSCAQNNEILILNLSSWREVDSDSLLIAYLNGRSVLLYFLTKYRASYSIEELSRFTFGAEDRFSTGVGWMNFFRWRYTAPPDASLLLYQAPAFEGPNWNQFCMDTLLHILRITWLG